MNLPDPDTIFPIPNVSTVTFIKPTITRPNIIAGDFSYYAGSDFEAHVDVWIGQNVTVLPGVHIGDVAVIGLNSTVTRDIPAYTIAAGNPARVIRKRFDDEMIALLEKLKWWDKTADEIKTLIPVLTCRNLGEVKRRISELLDRNSNHL